MTNCTACGEEIELVLKFVRAGLHRDPNQDSWVQARDKQGRFSGEREWKHIEVMAEWHEIA